jgi:amidophosphoribosyltransferase
MCGILGVMSSGPVNQLLYDGLLVLQHRGQDAAGIVTASDNTFHMHKGNGLVRDVFRTRDMRNLQGFTGIGHCRYPTAGSAMNPAEAQPFYVNSPFGVVLGHNGNLTNAEQLKRDLFKQDLRHVNTNSDSEVLLNVLAHELTAHAAGFRLTPEIIFAAVAGVHRRCRGAYAVVASIAGYGLLAFRDPYGIRPLVYGTAVTEQGVDYLVASESVALDTLGFKRARDVVPGEAIFIDTEGVFHSRQCAQNPTLNPCLFEYVYLARPDSVIDGISVYETRLRMGEALADKIQREHRDLDIDVVIPIPDSSRPAAMQLASRLGVPYREGFIKNRYIGRTFIMPGQAVRKRSVRQKLNAIGVEFAGRNVLLVDDSIVRGTTSREIVQMAREGADRQRSRRRRHRGRDRHRLPDLPGSRRADRRGVVGQSRGQELRGVVLLGRVRDRRRDARVPVRHRRDPQRRVARTCGFGRDHAARPQPDGSRRLTWPSFDRTMTRTHATTA